jgi:hypothetical protein
VKSRQVNFFVDDDQVDPILNELADQVVPRFIQFPHFLGWVLLKAETTGSRREIVALSFWDDVLEGSESISRDFRDEVRRIVGTNPTRKAFDILRVAIRDANGQPCLDL